MKKNLVIGTLLISTIVSAAAPSMAGPLERAVCNLQTIVTNDPSCRDRRPGPRDDRRDHRPRGGVDQVEVRDVSQRGERILLNLERAVGLSSVVVQGLGGEVRMNGARVFLADGTRYNLGVRGSVLHLSGHEAVTAVEVWVESRLDRRDRRDRWNRHREIDAQFRVQSDWGIPFVRVSRY